MTGWALIAAAITGAPSIAAVLVVGIWSAHRRWAAKQAAAAASEAMKHEHVWGLWGDPVSQECHKYGDPKTLEDIRERYTRTCDTCGLTEYKSYSLVKERWI